MDAPDANLLHGGNPDDNSSPKTSAAMPNEELNRESTRKVRIDGARLYVLRTEFGKRFEINPHRLQRLLLIFLELHEAEEF
jgi:hypothetical protein